MFTGIIQYIFEILVTNNTLVLYATPEFVKLIKIGDSVSINGVCLTVTACGSDGTCSFDLSEETLKKVNLTLGPANIELSLKTGDYQGGHIVSGHVNDIGRIMYVCKSHDDVGGTGVNSTDVGGTEVWIMAKIIGNIKYKGSIAVDGVSLTISDIKDNLFKVSLIPETIRNTIFQYKAIGDLVNIEYEEHNYLSDDEYMDMAIEESNKGRLTAPPNPWVGCVIVKSGRVLSVGHHEIYGSAHAEVNATSKLSEKDLDGSTLYVTLEPCCHHGKTPPCTNLIIKSKIKRVVIGVEDPDEKVSGSGIDILRSSGIQVDILDSWKVKHNLRAYLYHRVHGKPYVTLKLALTINNCYVDARGNSKWITTEESRREGHLLRAQSQTIMIGTKTALLDKPELTVRHGIMVTKQPDVAIVGTTANSVNFLGEGRDIKMFKTPEEAIASNTGIQILVEGGGELHYSLLERGLANELVLFRSSKYFPEGKPFQIPPNVQLNLIEAKKIHSFIENTSDMMEVYSIHTTPKDDIVFDDIDDAISLFQKGGFVIVMDDENRENEGDLIAAASLVRPSQITQLINDTTGIICVPMESSRAKKLGLEVMCSNNTDIHQTSFTVTADHVSTGTGVSTVDRWKTIRALALKDSTISDFRKPGHIFPLIAHPEGLNKRQGHTEASVSMCKLAGIEPPVAVIGELKNRDGTMKRLNKCYEYAKIYDIPIITVEQIKKRYERYDDLPKLSECVLETSLGDRPWTIQTYGTKKDFHKVFIYPFDFDSKDDLVPVRIHSECFTGDLFESKHCDCGQQLQLAKKYIVSKGKGIIIFPANHEGRGIGFVEKVKAYALQKEGKDTYEANEILGFSKDSRDYSGPVKILRKLGLVKIELLTENVDKITSLKEFEVITKPLLCSSNEINASYLQIKKMKTAPTPKKSIAWPLSKDYKIALVYSSWHIKYIDEILLKISGYFTKYGIKNIKKYSVPGCNEIPLKAQNVAKEFDAVICVGILIKGDTQHFENVSTATSIGINQASLNTNKPIMNCILSCYNLQQVVDRISGDKSTLEYIVDATVEMIC